MPWLMKSLCPRSRNVRWSRGASQLIRELEDRMGIREKKQRPPRIASILQNRLDHVVPAMVRETRVVLSGIKADHGIHWRGILCLEHERMPGPAL